jgi:hypothetical protein
MSLCTLTFVEGTLHQLLSNPYSNVHGNWLFASAKWGNSTSSEKAVRNWAYHTSQRPRGFCQRSLAKNVRGQSSPLRASCITFLGNTRRATASRTNVHNQLKVKAEMLKGKNCQLTIEGAYFTGCQNPFPVTLLIAARPLNGGWLKKPR